MQKLNINGRRFGNLIVIRDTTRDKYGHRMSFCLCDCGKTTNQITSRLNCNKVTSCGCLSYEHMRRKRTTHGHSGTRTKNGRRNISPTYNSWYAMKRRCKTRSTYIARNTQVCKRWENFENFLEDMGERPTDRTLDRINNKGNYCKENCRWATDTQQARNK